jgi:hypothetical protein
MRSYRKKMWADEPKEIEEALTGNPGTEGSLFFSAIYAVDDTKNLTHSLYTIRKAVRSENLDLHTVKRMMKYFLDDYIPWMGWLKLTETEEVLRGVSVDMSTIESREELIVFIEELILYVGRLNQWLDARMPWYELVQTYEASVKK